MLLDTWDLIFVFSLSDCHYLRMIYDTIRTYACSQSYLIQNEDHEVVKRGPREKGSNNTAHGKESADKGILS